MTSKISLITGIVLAGLAVAFGAFGAHLLKGMLEANGRTETFELAVKYQFYHAFALVMCGLLGRFVFSRHLKIASWSFTGGVIFFSGSLYLLSATNQKWLGAITPIGGLLFLSGWIFLLLAARKSS
jgi:uncharacterized membrane protein YgdD (TMEM256/DUF423 family)